MEFQGKIGHKITGIALITHQPNQHWIWGMDMKLLKPVEVDEKLINYSTSMGDLLNCHQICGIGGFNGPRICNGPYPWVWQSWHRPCCLVQSCRALGSAIRTILGNASRSCSIPYPGHPTELKKRKPVISWWAQFILGHKTAFAFSTIS